MRSDECSCPLPKRAGKDIPLEGRDRLRTVSAAPRPCGVGEVVVSFSIQATRYAADGKKRRFGNHPEKTEEGASTEGREEGASSSDFARSS